MCTEFLVNLFEHVCASWTEHDCQVIAAICKITCYPKSLQVHFKNVFSIQTAWTAAVGHPAYILQSSKLVSFSLGYVT